ncbi:GIY-YIG nuclease family protein [Alteromonas facilis]|uniref:GIY-YIG nuclease family protein n=1 Tax=Alteromonas facilis TaxID=2048004 RepID=UPI001F0C723E|nr:GIY-YIG nuclease family protein [Alteromonas facilis]
MNKEKSASKPEPHHWWVYMIENNRGHLYTGITTDVERRFKEHCSNSAKSAKALRGKDPLTLKFSQMIGNRSQASKVEIWIKKQTRTTKLAIIRGQGSIPSL